MTSEHRNLLERLLPGDGASDSLAVYLDIVAAWGRRMDLTSASTAQERVDVLVRPVIAARGVPQSGTLVDVGAGCGSPGLVLALLRPDLKVTLLEPRLRRWAFLREATRALGRADVTVLRARHDEYAGARAASVTIRALRLPPAELSSLTVEGGRLLVFGGSPVVCADLVPEDIVVPGVLIYRRQCST